jgi:hypothetical protein
VHAGRSISSISPTLRLLEWVVVSDWISEKTGEIKRRELQWAEESRRSAMRAQPFRPLLLLLQAQIQSDLEAYRRSYKPKCPDACIGRSEDRGFEVWGRPAGGLMFRVMMDVRDNDETAIFEVRWEPGYGPRPHGPRSMECNRHFSVRLRNGTPEFCPPHDVRSVSRECLESALFPS